MYAILLALKTFATDKSHTHIRIMTDNSTAVSFINPMGTSHSHSCNSMAKKIWEWCIERNIWLSERTYTERITLLQNLSPESS